MEATEHVNLPEYDRPPVREVLLGVQFDALERLGGPYIGLLWQEFRSRFGKIEEQPQLVFRPERFGLPMPEPPTVELVDSLAPRIWFVNDSGTELLQVQQDWFSHNWRKVDEDDKYPRFATLRAAFNDELAGLIYFVEREALGTFKPVQCEVTYVNLIRLGSDESIGDVLTVFKPDFSDGFLAEPENFGAHLRFLIPGNDGAPIGRLHVVAAPVIELKTQQMGIRLTLTARGYPDGDNPEAMFAFFDRGHEWIVRGFTSITTPKMHELWGRKQ
jgi:uncharacterized protein (TIGR04255 family)